MIDENEIRPFYKKNWFWITILSIFVVVSATTYVANYVVYQGKADQATVSQSKNVAKKKVEKNPSLITNYNSIKTGKDGFTTKEVLKLLGQPTSSTPVDADSQLMNLTWDDIDNENNISIQITFSKDKATAKSIQGLSIDRKKLLTSDDFNQIQNGDSYTHVMNILGNPDEYSDDNGIKTLTYQSNLDEIDPTQDASIEIDIMKNRVISTEQQNLQ